MARNCSWLYYLVERAVLNTTRLTVEGAGERKRETQGQREGGREGERERERERSHSRAPSGECFSYVLA
jgi:hypothetical protein